MSGGARLSAESPTPTPEDWSALLRALGEPARLRIVAVLLGGPLCVSEITERLNLKIYNVSRHIRTLREAGLVTSERDGHHVRVDLSPDLRTRLGGGSVLDLGCCQFDFGRLDGCCGEGH